MATASNLTLYSHTSLAEAMQTQPSVARKFFEGKSFEEWKKGQESVFKIQAAIVARLNGVINACGVIAKTIARVR